MQKDNFFDRMTGKGEIPISKMAGFHPPDDELHGYIEKKMHKKISREFLSSVLWSVFGVVFTIIYVYIHQKAKAGNDVYFFVTVAVFALIVVVNAYRAVAVDTKLDKIIKEKAYQVKEVKIHHVMPGYGTNLGKLTVKIQDEEENVYFSEFTLDRKMAKKYKKDTESEFLLLELDKERRIYSLITKEEKKEEKTEKTEKEAEEE